MVKLYKGLELEVAKVASLDPEMDAAASKVKAAVKSAAPKRTSAFADSIKTKTVRTKRGVHDREVYADDEEANLIEYGGVDKNGKVHRGHFTFTGVKEAFR